MYYDMLKYFYDVFKIEALDQDKNTNTWQPENLASKILQKCYNTYIKQDRGEI